MLFRVFRETRGYTTSNLITTEGLMTWSSEVFRKFSSHFLIWKSCKNRKLRRALCGISEFEENEKKCVYFVHNCLQFLQLYSFTYTTYKPSHHNHSIIPLSNHHTIIIPKSHNLRNIYIYVSNFDWFSYDFGMMVWMWYDGLNVVWLYDFSMMVW